MPHDSDYFQLKDLIQKYHDAVYELNRENHDRGRKLIAKLLQDRYENQVDNAHTSLVRILLSSSSMLNSILDASDNTKYESFCRHLILQCLNYYTDENDLLNDKVFSEYGIGVLIDDVYIISIIYSWLKEDLNLSDKLSSPADETLRLILGEGLTNELDNKAKELFRLSSE